MTSLQLTLRENGLAGSWGLTQGRLSAAAVLQPSPEPRLRARGPHGRMPWTQAHKTTGWAGSPVPAPSTSKPGGRPFLGGAILFSSLFLCHSSQPWQKPGFLLDALSFPALSCTDLLSLLVHLSGQEGELHPEPCPPSHSSSTRFLLGLQPSAHHVCTLGRSVVSDSTTLWTVAHQAPLSMGFARREYWSGLPFPPLGHLPDPGIEPESPVSPALAGGFLTTEPPVKPLTSLPRQVSPAYPLYLAFSTTDF